MKRQVVLAIVVLLGVSLVGSGGWALFRQENPGRQMTGLAQAFLKTLDVEQRSISQLPYDSPLRVDWHFIPKDARKGLQIKHMTEPQRQAAYALLRSGLSQVGYDKARKIMELETLLQELERGRQGGPIRDSERYYYTVFGEPTDQGRWGLSVEGHHLSLNFVVDKGQVISSTPTFYAANPAVVMQQVEGTDVKKGTRVLALEEQLAFDLLAMLDADQRKVAVIADTAPREIRAAGEPQPPADEKVGLSAARMNEAQSALLHRLIKAYAGNLPETIASQRIAAIQEAGLAEVRFAWAGADKPGVGHYYRIQGPTFLIEFVNTQPDAAGNPANHIHCVWRDMAGDFAIPLKQS